MIADYVKYLDNKDFKKILEVLTKKQFAVVKSKLDVVEEENLYSTKKTYSIWAVKVKATDKNTNTYFYSLEDYDVYCTNNKIQNEQLNLKQKEYQTLVFEALKQKSASKGVLYQQQINFFNNLLNLDNNDEKSVS